MAKSGDIPPELENEVQPEFWDEPIFDTFWELFQRDKEFYQTIYYYQKVIGIVFDGEDLSTLLILWNTAQKFLSDKENKKRNKERNKSKSGSPKGRSKGRR